MGTYGEGHNHLEEGRRARLRRAGAALRADHREVRLERLAHLALCR